MTERQDRDAARVSPSAVFPDAANTPTEATAAQGLDFRLEIVEEAALRVVVNAYGTKPRHTQARDGGCRDDCIPCGLAALARCFPTNGIAIRVVQAMEADRGS